MALKNKGTIIYTGNFSIEEMNAAGKRVFANALIMQKLGYHLVMVGTESIDEKSVDILSTHTCKDGIDLFHYPGKLFHKHRSNYSAFFKQFKKLIDVNRWNIKAIICYNSPSLAPFLGKTIKYCHKNNIKYITDVADWLIVDSDNPIFRTLRQFDITIKNAYYSNKSDGVIAISTWLSNYYKKKVDNVIVIPPVALERKMNSSSKSAKTEIVYAGMPFRKGCVIKNPSTMKDRFDLACKLLAYVKEMGVDFLFHVYGFEREDFLQSLPELRKELELMGDSICFHGFAKMEDVQIAVSHADYTILLREKNRMTMAGFPTKVSESITCGTPVITTKTSDIKNYLPEGHGTFFIDLNDMERSKKKLLNLLTKSSADRLRQKQECENIHAFDIDNYIEPVRKFLTLVLK